MANFGNTSYYMVCKALPRWWGARRGVRRSRCLAKMGREGEKRGHEEETTNKEVNQQAVRLSFLLPHTRWLRWHCYHSSAHWLHSNCWHRSAPAQLRWWWSERGWRRGSVWVGGTDQFLAGRGTWGGVLIRSLLLQSGGVGDWKGSAEARLKRVGYVWWEGGGGFLLAVGTSWDLVGYGAHLLLWLWPISLFFLFFSNLFVSMVSALLALPLSAYSLRPKISVVLENFRHITHRKKWLCYP